MRDDDRGAPGRRLIDHDDARRRSNRRRGRRGRRRRRAPVAERGLRERERIGRRKIAADGENRPVGTIVRAMIRHDRVAVDRRDRTHRARKLDARNAPAKSARCATRSASADGDPLCSVMLLVARCLASVSSAGANAGRRTTSASSANAAGKRAATASVVTSVRSGPGRASSVAPSASSANAISFADRVAVPRVSNEAVSDATPGDTVGIGNRAAWQREIGGDQRTSGNPHRNDAQPVGQRRRNRRRILHRARRTRRRRRRNRPGNGLALLRPDRADRSEHTADRKRERENRVHRDNAEALHFAAPCEPADAAV